tara:strand:+ start:888 stop:4643 length:3756 start_codon:yes stop_codon:yes gene_type:complete
MASITQTIPHYNGGISQQPDEKKLPGQVVEAKNVLPDLTRGLLKRPGGKLIAPLTIEDGTNNSQTNGRWFHYYRDETEQYIGQISRTGDVNIWRCSDGKEMHVENDSAKSAELVSYLTHTKDEDIQTLTLNDYTYITNRTKVTAMKNLLAGPYDGINNYNDVRPPEAFVELKKVAYASQYSLNLYDDDTLEDVTTATRISVKRVIDSSNSCTNETTFPSSGTLPGSVGHTSYCLNTNNEHEDSMCPNVDTRLISFNPGSAWDADDSNGVAGVFTYTRDGVEQAVFEKQTLSQYTVAPSQVYKLTGSDITDMTLPALSSTANAATFGALISSIKAHADYGSSGITVKAENSTTAVKEIQKIENVELGFNYSQYSPNILYWQIEGVTIAPQTQSGCNLACALLALQNHADYGSLAATVSLEAATNGNSDYRNIVFTFKENRETTSMSKMGNHHPDWGTGTVYTANTTATGAVEAIANKGDIVAEFTSTGDKALISIVKDPTGDAVTTAFVEDAVSSTIANPPKDLYLRITTNGQAVAESDEATPEYRCRYTTTYDLLYGGQNWLVGDYFEVWMKNAKYRITIDKISTSKVQANRGLIRPTPTSFDTKTVVTAESILGDLRTAIDDDENSNFNTNADGALNSAGTYVSGVKQVGNGLHITRPSGTFNISSPSPSLLNVFTNEIQDIGDLPSQCVNGYTVKIRNSEAAEDDYYVRFIADNGTDGTGVWEECPEPGRKIAFDTDSLPIQIKRNDNVTADQSGATHSEGWFKVEQVTWENCLVGNTLTVPEPSFIGKTINKLVFFRNRLVFLSDENIIMSQPGEFFNFWPRSAITYTATDNIDISCSSEYPAIVYDAIQVNSGLVLLTKNQQFMLTTDSDVLSPQTVKINALASYNFNYKTNPISLGTTIAFLDNAGQYSRFWEVAKVLREGEPDVINQTKIVSQLFDKEVTLISNSRENGIVFFSKKDTSTLYGFRYFNSSNERLHQAWFTWEITGTIQHHSILDDSLYIVVRNNGKDTLQKFSVKLHTDTITVTDDKSNDDATDDEDYRIHLDSVSAVTIPAGTYSENLNKTIFSKPDGYDNTTSQLYLYDNNTTSDYVGKCSKVSIINNDSTNSTLEVSGDWSNRTVLLGYSFDMQVKFPTIYYTKTADNIVESDTNASLIIHRIKLNFGPYGSYTTAIDRLGNSSYEETWEAPISDQYLLSNVSIDSEVTRTIPIYERNKNLTITLKSSDPSPATLYSMAWEGDYTSKFYNRV